MPDSRASSIAPKVEVVHDERFRTQEQMRRQVFKYIECDQEPGSWLRNDNSVPAHRTPSDNLFSDQKPN